MLLHPAAYSQSDIPVNANNTWNGENTLAVNLLDSSNLVVAWMKLNLLTVSIAVSHSDDGGQTWSSPLLMSHVQSGNTAADPTITADDEGAFYLAYIDYNPQLTGGAVYVTKSTDGGETWSDPVELINVNASPDLPVDRPWIAIDQSNGIHHGRIYVVTKSYFASPPPHAIWLIYSDDDGATWSTPVQVDSEWKVGLLLNSMGVPAVAADGALYINYASWDLSKSFYPRNVIARSTDGGLTFSNYAIANVVANSLENDTIAQFSWCLSANPADAGNLIAIWTDKISGDIDIYYSISNDAGITWNTAQRLNDDPVDNGIYQDMCWSGFSKSGVYGALWRDRRDVDTGQWAAYKVYGVISEDGGSTFSPNFSLASDSGNLFPGTAGNDFLGVALYDATIYGTWTDSRTGSNQLYFNRRDFSQIISVPDLMQEESSMHIYPQPAHDYFLLSGVPLPAIIQIADLSGREMMSVRKTRITLTDISQLNPGIYLMRVYTHNQVTSLKLVVE